MSLDWYVRSGPGTPLVGPLSYRDADRQARVLSTMESGTGLAEVVTFLGQRAGDPITYPAILFVDGIYARGKKFLGGRTAKFHSERELLDYAPDYGYKLNGFRVK